MVAAGGGGSVGSSYRCNGGSGGELIGLDGSRGGNGGSYTVSGGGTQTTPGRAGSGAVTALPAGFGFGGSRNANHGGGGRRWLLWWWTEDVTITV